MSKDFYGVGGHPDVDLSKAGLHAFLEFQHEFTALRNVRGVHKCPDQFITEELILVAPQTTNGLGLRRDSAEAFFQFNQRIGDQFVRDGLAVVKLSRQEDFEPSK